MSAYDDGGVAPEPRQIHQFECRWQHNDDFSPVASSMRADDTQWSFGRMRLWALHTADGGAAGGPAASVRYGTFDDGSAALAWRLRHPGSAELKPTRPEATRVLTGPAELLTPDVAVAVCHAGLPSGVGPRPGEFSVGSVRLPSVSSGALRRLVAERTGELDQSAARAPGLAWLVAAALQDRARPLAVQLPDREIAEPPADGRQAALLWGLRRITGPLLAGLDDQPPGARDWSFSTFEPPLGAKDPAALPGIVFRAQRDTQVATSTRDETLVRPSGQRPLITTDYDGVAKLLVHALANEGSEVLAEWLRSNFADYQRLADRFRVVYQSLHELYEPGGSGDVAAQLATPARAAEPVTPAVVGTRPEAADRPRVNTAPPRVPSGQPPRTQPGQPPRHVLRPSEQATDRPGALTSLLRRLDTGPGADFDAALHAITEGHLPSTGPDRAAARQLLADRGWFLLPLLQRDPWHYTEVLEVIFRCTVVPDLGDQEVTAELARWVDDYAAPHEVIVALDAAAQRAGYATLELMSALLLSLGRRWMTEHGMRAAPQAAPVTLASRGRTVARPAAPQPEQIRAPSMFARERLKDTVMLLQFLLFACNILLLILLLNSVIS
jgi:hypothetical protein